MLVSCERRRGKRRPERRLEGAQGETMPTLGINISKGGPAAGNLTR